MRGFNLGSGFERVTVAAFAAAPLHQAKRPGDERQGRRQAHKRDQNDAEREEQNQTAVQERLTGAEDQLKRVDLRAPQAGTVHQLAVHTVGGVVTTGQALMEIVPDDTLEVEATVENKDIGFVNAGQDAVIKLETFPYTRYGYLTGKVVSVSNDAVQNKKLGLAFITRIHLPTNRIHIENKWIALTPGMAVNAEIKTGKRTVGEYFLGPLVQGMQESMHEH